MINEATIAAARGIIAQLHGSVQHFLLLAHLALCHTQSPITDMLAL
jgi:hypothetical protein